METKVVFVGNACTGKTHTLLELITGDSRWRNKPYIPTVGVSVHSYQAEKEMPIFQIWDTAGQVNNTGLTAGYYFGSKKAIIFTGSLEEINPAHYGNRTVVEWQADLQKVVPEIKIHILQDATAAKLKHLLK